MQQKEREQQMSPAERRRRTEARKRRQKAEQRRRQKKLLLYIGGGVLAAVLIGLIIFGVTKLTAGGSKEITAQNGTFVIALDAGHGGEDIGQSNGETVEKNVTLDICNKLKSMLEDQLHYQVVMIREDDTRISKEERVQAANDSHADLLISIHCGYAENTSETGAVSHYKKDSSASEDLADMIQEALEDVSGIPNGGAREGSYEIISSTEMPAVLVEIGYLSNMEEAGSLSDDQYQSTAARGIATAIAKKLGQSS